MRNQIISIWLMVGLLCLCSRPGFAEGKKWALLIGIEEYDRKDISQLRFAVKDVNAIALSLQNLGYEQANVRTMTSAIKDPDDPLRPTNDNVLATLERLAKSVQPEDTFLFYFTGHGFTKEYEVKEENGTKKKIENFLASVNTNPATINTLRRSAISLTDLQNAMKEFKAKQILFVIDACRNDPEAAKGDADNKETDDFSKSLVVASKAAKTSATGVLFACSPGERAFEDSKKEHSVFTYYLLQVMTGKAGGKGPLTMADVEKYVRTHVGKWADDNNKKQTPELLPKEANTLVLADKITAMQDNPLPAEPKEAGAVAANVPGRVPHLDAKYGMDLVKIPAGEFSMGSAENEIEALQALKAGVREWIVGEFPQHKVYLDTYYIMKTPVTVRQYLAFCAATSRTMPDAPNFNSNWSQQNHPMVNVSWNDAMDYCAWLSKETGSQVKLPTEAQWEKAARGEDSRTFPWGNRFDSRCLQCSQQTLGNAGGTASVGSFPLGASPHGVLDMAGNVWQWCSDWYDGSYYANSPMRNPTGPGSGQYHVLRGGSWNNFDAFIFRCANRGRATPANRAFWNGGIGFRCVVSANAN